MSQNISAKKIVGQSIPRIDAPIKATGKARYTGDMKLPGMLYGKMLFSTVPHARIVSIDVSKALALPGVKDVIVGKDTPGIKFGNWRLFPQTKFDLLAMPLRRSRPFLRISPKRP
jgi:4-hydroxybenzoyl-CoA reductase subunit alpha